jgi:hypothetical protein
MSISELGKLFPEYKSFFTHSSCEDCVKSMGKSEKKGKVLYRFFRDAVSGNQWKTNLDLRKVLQSCIAHKKLVSGKYEAKFKEIRQVFEKEVGKEEKAEMNASPQKRKQEEIQECPPSKKPAVEQQTEVHVKAKVTELVNQEPQEQLPEISPVETSGQNFFQRLLGEPAQDMTRDYEAPYRREFNEKTMPELAERFSSLGGLRSSAFRNAAARAGAELEENLAYLKANRAQQFIDQQIQGANVGLGYAQLSQQRYEQQSNQAPQAQLQDFSAPTLRQLKEEILPGIKEWFSARGGMRSSGFRNEMSRAIGQYLESLGTPIGQQLLSEFRRDGFDKFKLAHGL